MNVLENQRFSQGCNLMQCAAKLWTVLLKIGSALALPENNDIIEGATRCFEV